MNKIIARTDNLEQHTKIVKIVAEFNNEAIRELIEGYYRIIYKIVSDDEVAIIRVYHGARILKEL